jgi:hypothetical protein
LGVLNKSKDGFGSETEAIMKLATQALIDLAANYDPKNVPDEIKKALLATIQNKGLSDEFRKTTLEKFIGIVDAEIAEAQKTKKDGKAPNDATELAKILKDYVSLPTTMNKPKDSLEISENLFKKAYDLIIKYGKSESIGQLTSISVTGSKFSLSSTITVPFVSYKNEKDAKKKDEAREKLINDMYAFGQTLFKIEGLNTAASLTHKLKSTELDTKTNSRLKAIIKEDIKNYCEKANGYLTEFETVKEIYKESKDKTDYLKLVRDMLKNLQSGLFFITAQRINKLLPKLDSSFEIDKTALVNGLIDENGNINNAGLVAIQDYIDKRKDYYRILLGNDSDLKEIEDSFAKTFETYNKVAKILVSDLKTDAFNLGTLVDHVINNPLLDKAFVQSAAEKILDLAKPTAKTPAITNALLALLNTKGLSTEHYKKIAAKLMDFDKAKLIESVKLLTENHEDTFANDEARLSIAEAIIEAPEYNIDALNAVAQAKLTNPRNLEYSDKEDKIRSNAYNKIASISSNSKALRLGIITGEKAPNLDKKQFMIASLPSLDKEEIINFLKQGISNKLILDKALWKKLVEQYLSNFDPSNGGLMINSYYKFFRDTKNQTLAPLFRGDALDKEVFKNPVLVAFMETMIDKFQELKINELDVAKDVFKVVSSKDIMDGLDESYYSKAARIIKDTNKPSELIKLANNSYLSKEARSALTHVILDLEGNGNQKPIGCIRLIKATVQIGGWEDIDGEISSAKPTDKQARPELNIDYIDLRKLWQTVDDYVAKSPSVAVELRDAYWQKQYLELNRTIPRSMRTGHSLTADRLRDVLATGSEGLIAG